MISADENELIRHENEKNIKNYFVYFMVYLNNEK